MRRLCQALCCALLLALSIAAGAQPRQRPVLVLVSIDGWRWDYLQTFKPPALTALAARGVTADGLIPTFPSKTFPNHYTVATGLYPDRHGIVSNNMRDPALPGTFSLGNEAVQQDTRWWGGVPLWVTVERQGGVSATMFWPGSDREIAGDRPTYWRPYDGDVTNAERVDQVLAWLDRPAAERPTFVTLYFEEVDSASHDGSPESPATRTAALNVDAAIGRLMSGIAAANLTAQVNVVVVSDHGMATTSPERTIFIDDYLDLSTIDVVDWSPIFGATPRSGAADALYERLRGKHPAMQVFRNEELPARYRLAGHPRYPAVIGIADDGWTITSRERAKRFAGESPTTGGNHGYDPMHRSMHGLFIAAGPSFPSGVQVPRFENVHVYELLCRLLGVRPEANDGDPNVTAGFVR